jgi:hypothetical protein
LQSNTKGLFEIIRLDEYARDERAMLWLRRGLRMLYIFYGLQGSEAGDRKDRPSSSTFQSRKPMIVARKIPAILHLRPSRTQVRKTEAASSSLGSEEARGCLMPIA